MDWSLVLASQGIEHTIAEPDQAGWSLTVTAVDEPAAVAAIRLYRAENRHWPWQRTIPQTDELFDWAATVWVLLTIGFYWLSGQNPKIRDTGLVDGDAVASGEWWRLFTGTLLHADLAHLAANAGFGFLLLGLAMGRYGTGVGLLAALLAGAGGNLVSLLVHGKGFHGLGASGVVMGALGLVAVQSFTHLRQHPHALRFVLASLAGGVMLFVLLGLSPGTDVIAHFGGFVSGIGLGFLLSALPLTRRPIINLAAGIAFATLVLGTWMLALRHAG